MYIFFFVLFHGMNCNIFFSWTDMAKMETTPSQYMYEIPGMTQYKCRNMHPMSNPFQGKKTLNQREKKSWQFKNKILSSLAMLYNLVFNLQLHIWSTTPYRHTDTFPHKSCIPTCPDAYHTRPTNIYTNPFAADQEGLEPRAIPLKRRTTEKRKVT